MAPNRGRDRTGVFEEHEGVKVNDLDPEGDYISEASEDDDDSSRSEAGENGGRTHYSEVEQSKLRKSKTAPLGPRYRGSRVSRDDVEDVDDDDPFCRGFEEEDSDDVIGRNATINGGDESSSAQGEDDEDQTDDTDIEEDDGAAAPTPSEMMSATQRDQMLKAAQKDQHAVTSSLAQSMKSEAEKGRAVKKQRSAFDALLGARIKLQKSVVATNTTVGLDEDDLAVQREAAQVAMETAEAAAFKLWSSLNDLREDLYAARTGEKRKRSTITSTTTTGDLWTHMQEREETNLPHRNVVLQRWSAKTRDPSLRAQGALLKKAEQTPIIDSIQQHLTNSGHLLRKAHTPRSCAPLQVANKVNEDPKIYDDVDFYGLMLKELLESKSSDTLAASAIDFDPRREAKTKKHVDTKASKGRKLRYTVHDKLQNFMAPEDRRRWGERQADELFGSLFGRSLGLGEDVEQDAGMVDGDDDGESEVLQLFRT